MEESDIREIGNTKSKDKINEDILRNGLEVNGETNRKGKAFKTYRKLTTENTVNESSNNQKQTTKADSPHVKITVLDTESLKTTAIPRKSFRQTTVKPEESTTDNEEDLMESTFAEDQVETTTARNKYARTGPTTGLPATTESSESSTTEEQESTTVKTKFSRTRPTRLPGTTTTQKIEETTSEDDDVTTEIVESTFAEDQTTARNKYSRTGPTRLPATTESSESSTTEEQENTTVKTKFSRTRPTRLPGTTTTQKIEETTFEDDDETTEKTEIVESTFAEDQTTASNKYSRTGPTRLPATTETSESSKTEEQENTTVKTKFSRTRPTRLPGTTTTQKIEESTFEDNDDETSEKTEIETTSTTEASKTTVLPRNRFRLPTKKPVESTTSNEEDLTESNFAVDQVQTTAERNKYFRTGPTRLPTTTKSSEISTTEEPESTTVKTKFSRIRPTRLPVTSTTQIIEETTIEDDDETSENTEIETASTTEAFITETVETTSNADILENNEIKTFSSLVEEIETEVNDKSETEDSNTIEALTTETLATEILGTTSNAEILENSETKTFSPSVEEIETQVTDKTETEYSNTMETSLDKSTSETDNELKADIDEETVTEDTTDIINKVDSNTEGKLNSDLQKDDDSVTTENPQEENAKVDENGSTTESTATEDIINESSSTMTESSDLEKTISLPESTTESVTERKGIIRKRIRVTTANPNEIETSKDEESVDDLTTETSLETSTENSSELPTVSSADKPSRKPYNVVNRPLIKSTTTKLPNQPSSKSFEDSSTKRSFSRINRFQTTTEKNTNEEDVEVDDNTDENYELSTRKTFLQVTRSKGPLFRTTTTTTKAPITERSTSKPINRLIRYSTTTYKSVIDDEEDFEENEEQIDATTRRSFNQRNKVIPTKRPVNTIKASTTEASANEEDLEEIEKDEERIEEKKVDTSTRRGFVIPSRRPFGALKTIKAPTTEASFKEEDLEEHETEQEHIDETKVETSTRRSFGTLQQRTNVLATRRPFGALNTIKSSTTEAPQIEEDLEEIEDGEENIDEKKIETSTRRSFGTLQQRTNVLATRRPYGALNIIKDSTTETPQNEEDLEEIVEEDEKIETSTRRIFGTLQQRTNVNPTRRAFGALTGFRTSTTEAPEEETDEGDSSENLTQDEETTTKRTLPTRRPFALNRPPTTTKTPISDGTTEDDSESHLENENELSTTRTLPTRRPFGVLNRSTTTTEKALVEDEISISTIISNKEEEEEESTKRAFPTRKPFGGLNRSTSTTTAASVEDETSNSNTETYLENENDSTESSLPSTTTEAQLVVENLTDLESEKDLEQHQQPLEVTTALNLDESTAPRRKVIIRKRIRVSTTTTASPTETSTDEPVELNELISTTEGQVSERTDESEISTVETSTTSVPTRRSFIRNRPVSTTSQSTGETISSTETQVSESSDANEDESEVSTSETPSTSLPTRRSFLRNRPVSTTPQSTVIKSVESKNESVESNNESSTIRKPLLPTNRPRTLFTRTTTKAPEPEVLDEEEEITSEPTQLESTTRKTFNRINRFKSLRESLVKEQTENESTTKKTYSGFNRFKSSTETSLDLESENDKDQETEAIEVSTRRSLGSFNQRQRLNFNSGTQEETITQKSRLNFNRNLYNNRNIEQEEETDKNEDNEKETTRSKFGSLRQQLIKTETKPSVKPFNFNRPQFKRPLASKPEQNQEEEYDEKEDNEEDGDRDRDTDETEDEYSDEDENSTQEKKDQLASQELASKEPSSTLFIVRNHVRLGQTQEKDSQQGLVNDRLKNLLTTRAKTQTTVATETSDLTQEDNDKEVAIKSDTNTNSISSRYGTYRSNSTVANYLNRAKTNLSQTTTNQAPSHVNDQNINETDNNEKLEDDEGEDNENSNKSNVNDIKGNDNDSKRRFQKYQFQRRTTTTTTTTEKPVESNEDNDGEEDVVTKAQVNENDSESSTIISETSAPTTESPSSPATPLARRIKVLKLKRPVVSNNNTTTLASSATNFNASHTETQNIVKLSSVSEVEEQLVKTHTLTEIETQTEIPSQTNSPTPKRFRKVIRKLIRPVNRTAEVSNEEKPAETTTDIDLSTFTTAKPVSTFLQRRQNATRLGFNRSSKFALSSQNSNIVDEVEEEKEVSVEDEDLTEERTPSAVNNRGRNKFTLPSAVTSSTRSSLFANTNRNRFASRQQSSSTTTTTEGSKSSEEVDEDDEEEEGEEDEEEQVKETTPVTESKETGDSKYTSTNRFRPSKPLTTTATILENNEEENTEDSTATQLVTEAKESSSTTLGDLQKLRNKVRIDSSKQQDLGVLSDRFKTIKSDTEDQETEDPLLKLRNKVKLDSAKGNQDEGVLSDRFKTFKSDTDDQETEDPLLKLRNKVKLDSAKGNQDEGVLSDRFKTFKSDTEEQQTDDPLLKLRNKVKLDSAKGNQEEGVLSDRFKTIKSDTEEQQTDDPLLKLRNKVQQDLAKGNQEDGVVSSKFKKLLETKSNTSTFNYKVEGAANDSDSDESLNLQKIRDKVQSNLVKGDQDQGVVSSRLKKLLSERSQSKQTDTNTVEEEATTEIKESSGEEDLVDVPKSFTPRRPFTPRTKLTQVDKDDSSLETSTSTPREKPTFRRKLIAKRPYTPTKPSLSALATSTVKIPSTKGKNKYVRRKFGRFHPFNASNRNTGEGFVRKDPRGNVLPGADRFKVEGSAGGQNGEGEDYEEYDGDEEEEEGEDGEEEQEEEVAKPETPIVPIVRPVIARPPGLFSRPPSSILKKPSSKEQETEDTESDVEEEEEEEEEEDNDEEKPEEEADGDNESSEKQTDLPVFNRPTYKPKDNRIPPGARPSLNTSNKPFTPSRSANRPAGSTPTTAPNVSGNRFGSSARSTLKPRVVNRPLGVAPPNLTLKPVAKDYERTTVLIPTKPAPFINTNTRAYERKYTGPSTEASVNQDNDNNPLIEDLNIEALNARNKKIFDIHSKKHTPLKQKVLIPFGNLNENTQQEQINTVSENDEGYQSSSSLDGFATTTITTPLATPQDSTQNTEDENLSNAINLNEISSQDSSTTTPPPSTTLLHIFTLSDDEHTTKNPLEDENLVLTRHGEQAKPKHKVVEINRIVEINSKEEKLRRKSKANTVRTIEGSQTYKVESLPHVEQLGEISVVKYVHQVDGSDITVEGRSHVTDYTATEASLSKVSQPVRNSYPEGNVEHMEERFGKALIPDILREAVETSTISLEGLFEHARKGKVLNTVDDVTFAQQQDVNADSFKAQVTENSKLQIENSTEKPKELNVVTVTESSTSKPIETTTQSFNILKSIAFDVAKINLEPNSAESEESKKSSESFSTTSSQSFSSTNTNANEKLSLNAQLATTLAPETLNVESSTVAKEEMKATTVAAALFPQYLRTSTTANIGGLTVTRRPVLSVRRRLVNTSTATAIAAAAAALQQSTTPVFTTQQVSSSTGNDEYITTSKFKRLRTNRPPSLNSAAVDITSYTTETLQKASNKLKKKSSDSLAKDLKLASSSLTSSSAVDNDITAKQTTKYPSSQQTSAQLRRKFQSRRLTTTIASNTNSDGTATEPPRTQNPLFKRRFSLTTFSPLTIKTVLPPKAAAAATTLRTSIDSLTTTIYVDGLENDEDTDQVAKSSIHTSRFNQINGRHHTDDDDEEELVGDGGGVGVGIADVKHVVNTLKPTTTLSVATATRQPSTSRISQQQQQQTNFNFEDVITRRMDGTGTMVKASTTTTTSTTTTETPVIKKRKMIIKRRPQKTTPSSEVSTPAARRRKPHKYQEPFEKINNNQSKNTVKSSTQPGRTYRPNLDYDYYDDEDVRFVGNRSDNQLKVILHGGGIIECLDHGNFPHPLSCRKFISCAKYETGGVVGWEYTCPKGLSYDPVGGMCNWSAGLGCKE